MPRRNFDDPRYTRTCEVCGESFQQKRSGQRTCSLPKPCRARLPHNTGGARAKAGLDPRRCQNPECGRAFQPVRDSQVACSRTCLLKSPSYIESQQRAESSRADRRRGSGYRRLENVSDLERQRFRNLRGNMRRLYGLDLTFDQYAEWLRQRDGHCEICRREVQGRNAHTDHDHETGQLRGQLCYNCNLAIGMLKDDPRLFRAAAEYIERHRKLVPVGGTEA